MPPRPKSLGDVIREARVAKGWSLREFVKKLGITPSYQSDIENDRRIPAEDVLRRSAELLDLEFTKLMALGGRLGDDSVEYMVRTPAVGVLFRKLTDADAPEAFIEQLNKQVDQAYSPRRPKRTDR